MDSKEAADKTKPYLQLLFVYGGWPDTNGGAGIPRG
mgnify:CR=1 FL=1|jgi:hypothetical protein